MRLNRRSLSARLYKERPGVIFVHIPKTGGSSVASALRRHYRFSHFNVRSEDSSLAAEKLFGVTSNEPAFERYRAKLRSALMFYAAQQGVKFITGHFWYDSHMPALRELNYTLLTLLRHPVERWYSAYFYGRHKSGDYARIRLSFDEFIDSLAGRSLGATYVRALAGSQIEDDGTSRGAIDKAKRILDEFDLVGFLEDLPAIKEQIFKRCGLKLKIPHKRRSPARKNPLHQAEVIRYKQSDHYREIVESLCAPDLELYQYARLRFAARTPDQEIAVP